MGSGVHASRLTPVGLRGNPRSLENRAGTAGMLHTTGFSQSSDRIAIVGIGCSFPGGVDSLDSLWDLLCQGGDAVVDVPSHRWNADAVYDPQPGVPGKTASRRAGLLRDVASFDAGFFGISPREAAVMDPQQRLL